MTKKSFNKFLISIFLAIAPLTSLSADLGLIDGIWQDESRKDSYYSIAQNGIAIVMIDLKRLEAGRDTLAATYTGAFKQDILY